MSHALHTLHYLILNRVFSCKLQSLIDCLWKKDAIIKSSTFLAIPQRCLEGWKTRLKTELSKAIPTPPKLVWWEKSQLLPKTRVVHPVTFYARKRTSQQMLVPLILLQFLPPWSFSCCTAATSPVLETMEICWRADSVWLYTCSKDV